MRTFTINGKRYNAKPFNYNTVCNLEDNGVSIADMSKKPMSMARAYFALYFGGDIDKAGDEIDAHVQNGGDLNEIYTVIGEEINDSGFFQALSKKTEEETPEVENPKKK